MLTYIFNAKNSEGVPIVGQINADCREKAVIDLKQKGYFLLSLESENKFSAIFRSESLRFGHVSVKEKAVFTQQLAVLLKAGVQLTVALKALSKQGQNKRLSVAINQIYQNMEESSSLSDAMAKHPKIFSRVYTAIIQTAEEAGNLVETLFVLSRQLKAQASVNTRIKSALVYPIFLLVVSVAVVGVLFTFVIPKFTELFVNANQALPLPTKILLAVTDFMKDFWPMLILTMSGMLCVFLSVLRNKRTRANIDAFMLKLPLLGPVNRKLQLARFTRTLGSLLNGGVKIISAISTTRGTIANQAFAGQIDNIEESILKGSTLADAIGQLEYFNQIAVNMIAVGEQTGTLPEMLLETADMYDQECESAISTVTDLLGPMMIVVLGLVIGFIVLAILMPIFETSTMVN